MDNEREMVMTRHRAREEMQCGSAHSFESERQIHESERHVSGVTCTNDVVEVHETNSCDRDSHDDTNRPNLRRGDIINSQNDQTQKDVNHCISNIEAKVASLESSLVNVTQELTNALRNIHINTQGHTSRHKNKSDNRNSNRHRHRSHSESDSDSDNFMSSSSVPLTRRNKHSPKLPPFTGKESWNVWFNRFEDVASRQNWGTEERLDEILPRLQGPAGDFVYGQLSLDIRTNYKTLCKELSNRFRVVETSKTFWVQFNHRNQRNGETVEEYAAELKKLYDKAHVKRDKQTRQEDLLRRYLDGLIDDKARFHVEFIKEPKDIDEAVYFSVCFQETKHKANTSEQRARCMYEDNDSESESENEIARMMPGKNKTRIITKVNAPSQNTETKDLGKLREIIWEELRAITEHKEIDQNDQNKQFRSYQNSTQTKPTYGHNQTRKACFFCNEPTHFKKDCPKYQQSIAHNQNRYQQWGNNMHATHGASVNKGQGYQNVQRVQGQGYQNFQTGQGQRHAFYANDDNAVHHLNC